MAFILLNALVIIFLVCLIRILTKKTGVDISTLNKRLKQIKFIENRLEEQNKARESTSKFLNRLYSWVKYLKLFNVSDKKQQELDYIALRLHKEYNGVNLGGNELFALRGASMLLYIFVVLLISLINFKLLPLVFFYPLIGSIVESLWYGKIRTQDEMIEEDFFDFFSEFYFTYKFPDNIRENVEDVAMRFYNRANDETKHMINLFRADAKIGEEYALDNLKKNFKLVKITRMCDQIKLIISGKPIGVEGLNAFKEELNSTRRFVRQQQNEERKEKAQKIIIVPIILMMLVIFSWIIVMLTQKMN